MATPLPGQEDEIIVRCTALDERLMRLIYALKTQQDKIMGYVEDKIVKLEPGEVFYFESVDNKVFAYTDKGVYEVRRKLYEIEEEYGHIEWMDGREERMNVFRDFIKWFSYITMGILIVCAVNFTLYGSDTIPMVTLWQILLSGALTTLVTMLLYPKEGRRKMTVLVGTLIHYAALCGVMIACGYWFSWMSLDAAGIRMMCLSVAGVYVLTFTAYYIVDLKQAEKINQRLKEKYPN